MFKNFDWLIFLYIVFIFSLGLIVLYSVAPEQVSHQLIYFGLGLFFFFLFSNIDYRIFQSFHYVFYILSIFSLLLTPFLGRLTRGTLRWISIGPFTLQPSELVKPFLILSFSGLIFRKDLSKIKNLLLFLFLFLPLGFLIFFQPSLGSTLVAFVIWLSIVFTAGIRPSSFLIALFSGGLLLPVGWRALADYQKKRIIAFLNPQADPLGGGYHLIQSKITVGSGQIFGKGLGLGTQSHLKFLPEFQSDFIFAALAEELGLIGSFILILCYFLLFWRILKIAGNSRNKFGRLIAIGVFSMLFFQSFVNIGMNIGLTPIAGITLPLVSSGGSSLVATLISLGLIESIARVEKKEF
ncbi:rod shape-determining protein RodA [Candidatus Microgenomates bacterium]|nr:rod shape-determining protein RodA [Candidatus Microgenomates bacterium]